MSFIFTTVEKFCISDQRYCLWSVKDWGYSPFMLFDSTREEVFLLKG